MSSELKWNKALVLRTLYGVIRKIHWQKFHFEKTQHRLNAWAILQTGKLSTSARLTDSNGNGNYISIRMNVIKMRHYFWWLRFASVRITCKSVCAIAPDSPSSSFLRLFLYFQCIVRILKFYIHRGPVVGNRNYAHHQFIAREREKSAIKWKHTIEYLR